MRRNYLDKLASGRAGDRMAAWRELEFEPQATCGVLSAKDRRELCEILCEEEDDGVRMRGILAMLSLIGSEPIVDSACDPGALARPGHLPHPGAPTLDVWFSQLFKKPSALVGIKEQNFHRRDEDALVHVARRFPSWMYQTTDYTVWVPSSQ